MRLLRCWRVWAGGFAQRGRTDQEDATDSRGTPPAHNYRAERQQRKRPHFVRVDCLMAHMMREARAMRQASPCSWRCITSHGAGLVGALLPEGDLVPRCTNGHRPTVGAWFSRGTELSAGTIGHRPRLAPAKPERVPGFPWSRSEGVRAVVHKKFMQNIAKGLDFPTWLCYTVPVRWHSESYPAQPSCPRAPSLRVSGELRVAV